jgi:HK97 family phage portal protein
MGMLDKLKGWLGSEPKKLDLTELPPGSPQMRRISKSLQADPEDYERYDYNQADTYRSNRVNPSAEILDFLALYQVNPHIYACVNAVATAIASVEFQLQKGGVKVAPGHEVHNLLMKPNPHQVWYELQEMTIGFAELCGNAFWEKVRDDKGKLLAFYPLRPDKVRIIPHPKVKVAGYIYCPRPGIEILYGRDEIVHWKYFSSTDEYWGVSPAYAAQNAVILDIYSTAYNKKFFQSSAVPEGVLETAGTISDATYQRLRQDWAKRHRGVENAFELAILEEGLTYKPIGFNQRDMQMVELKTMAAEEILAAYKVPPAIVGFLRERGNAGSLREQKKMFWMDNILPKLKRMQQLINSEIIPQGQDLELRFVTENIASLIEDIQISTSVAMQLVTHGIMTINEVRKKLFNLEEADWGKTPWIPVGLAQYDSGVHPNSPNAPHITGMIDEEPGGRVTEADPQNPAKPQPGAGGGTPNQGPTNVNQARNQSTPMGGSLPSMKRYPGVDFEKLTRPDPDWTNKQQVRDWQKWKIWKGLATPDYKELAAFFKDYFAHQFARVTKGIRPKYMAANKNKKVEKGRAQKIAEEAWTDPYRMVKATYDDDVERMLFDITEEASGLRANVIPKAGKIIKKHGNSTLGTLGADEDFQLDNERVVDFLKKHAGEQMDGITKKTRQLMGRELSKAVEDGEDFDQMMERLNNVFKGDLAEWRARTIARTEVVTLTQFAGLEAARQSGVVEKKRWVSELLDTTRDDPKGEDHRAMHDQTIALDDVFHVPARKGEVNLMDGPGDPEGSPENIVNCLCILDFPGTTEELEDVEGDLAPEEE